MSHRAAAGGDTSPCLIVVPTQTSYELEQPTKVRMKRKWPLQGTSQWFLKKKSFGSPGWPAALPRLQPSQPSEMTTLVAGYIHRKRRPHSGGSSCLGTVPNPRNFLMTGGGRAVDRERDDQLISLNKAAIKAGCKLL